MEKNHNIDRDPISNPNGDQLVDLETERHESTKKTSSCSKYWLLILPFILIPLIPILYYTLDVTMTGPPCNRTASDLSCGCVTLQIKVLNSENNSPVTSAYVSITNPDSSSLSAVQVNRLGIVEFHSCQIGTFEVHVESDGFIKATETIEADSHYADITIQRLVSISPKLEAGQTRIIMSWGTESPRDVDLHVVSVKKSDQSTCRTYYSNMNGCT